MRVVALKFHVVEGDTASMTFPAEELGLLFQTAGIELDLIEGERIDKDPTFNRIGYPEWIKRFGETDREAGHLILGRDAPGYRTDIAGELLDKESRGAAVVYTSCDYIQRDGAGALLQTCAHEIGHMLNLSHDDTAAGFVSTMNQAAMRDLDTVSAWHGATVESQQIRSSNGPDYFFPPARKLVSYPLAYRARYKLNTLSPARLLPWGGIYEYPGEADDVRRPAGVFRPSPEQSAENVEHQEEFHS